MEDLKFLDHDLIDKNYSKIEQMLVTYGINLVLKLDDEEQRDMVR